MERKYITRAGCSAYPCSAIKSSSSRETRIRSVRCVSGYERFVVNISSGFYFLTPREGCVHV